MEEESGEEEDEKGSWSHGDDDWVFAVNFLCRKKTEELTFRNKGNGMEIFFGCSTSTHTTMQERYTTRTDRLDLEMEGEETPLVGWTEAGLRGLVLSTRIAFKICARWLDAR
jgi:hypothetical protein